ncbi:MAG TPA: protease pro-enzyme activation domain-containing protein, partial [Nevskia sp.]|nr:protease pro-enzyme activation domain-containing protein [Nevskia sp.]
MSAPVLKLSIPLALLLAATASAAPVSRLAAAVDARSSVVLHGSVRPQVRAGEDHGRLDGTTMLHGVSLKLGLSPAQEADLDGLLARLQDPASPDYHAWLTPQQYAARFGLSAQDQARIEAWLRGQGLSIDSISPSGNQFRFSGSVARIEAVFQTELHRYQADSESHFANAS